MQEELIEAALKNLLQQMLSVLEEHIHTKQDLKEIEMYLTDYSSLLELVDTTLHIFKVLIKKITATESITGKYFKSESKQPYNQLEKVIQKHEQEIREHIRAEHELKLYAEQLQQQLEESEQTRHDFTKETTKLIATLKKENHDLLIESKKSSRKTVNNNTSTVIAQAQISKDNSVQQFNQLVKSSQRSVNKRNQSYSVGVSKQSSASNSFVNPALMKLLNQRQKSYHTDKKYRASLQQLKQVYKLA